MISIIVPLFNEQKNVPLLVERLLPILDSCEEKYEVLLIDDGSTDGTSQQIESAALQHPQCKAVQLRRNYGQTAAMMAGIRFSQGDIIIPLDGDLQNDPNDIPNLLKKLNEGYDLVSGWRKNRKDHALRRNLPSRIANWLISRISGVKLHDYGCTLKAYRKDVLRDVNLYGEMHRFIPIYAAMHGAKVTEIPVNHQERIHGQSKYGLNRVIKVLLDLMVVKFLSKYFTKPIYIFGGFSLLCLLLSFTMGMWSIFLKFLKQVSFIQTPLPLLSVMFFLIGITSLLLGLVAETIIRVYYEAQQKPTYSVRNTLNVENLE